MLLVEQVVRTDVLLPHSAKGIGAITRMRTSFYQLDEFDEMSSSS